MLIPSVSGLRACLSCTLQIHFMCCAVSVDYAWTGGQLDPGPRRMDSIVMSRWPMQLHAGLCDQMRAPLLTSTTFY